MAGQIQTGDVGTELTVVVSDRSGLVPLDTATVLTFFLRRPDGTAVTAPGVIVPLVVGQMTYVTVASDPVFDVPGTWLVQGYIEMAGKKFHTSTSSIVVSPNLN